MSLAAETREAVRNRPALFQALRAGVVNYTAAADSLAVDGDREAIATALRRFAADLDEAQSAATERSITVRLHSSIEAVDAKTLLAVDGAGIALSGESSDGSRETTVDEQTAVRATGDVDEQTAVRVAGDVDARLLSATLERLGVADVPVAAAGVVDETMVVVVDRRDGPTTVQLIEAVADSVY